MRAITVRLPQQPAGCQVEASELNAWAGALLDEAAEDGKSGVLAEVQSRNEFSHPLNVEQLRVDSVAPHRVGPAALGVEVVAAVRAMM